MLYKMVCSTTIMKGGRAVFAVLHTTRLIHWSGFTMVQPIYLPQIKPVVHFFKRKRNGFQCTLC
jgi:hypothetical protein